MAGSVRVPLGTEGRPLRRSRPPPLSLPGWGVGRGKSWVSSVVFRRRLRQTGAGSNLAKSTTFGHLCEKPSAAGCVQSAPAAPPGSIGEIHAWFFFSPPSGVRARLVGLGFSERPAVRPLSTTQGPDLETHLITERGGQLVEHGQSRGSALALVFGFRVSIRFLRRSPGHNRVFPARSLAHGHLPAR